MYTREEVDSAVFIALNVLQKAMAKKDHKNVYIQIKIFIEMLFT